MHTHRVGVAVVVLAGAGVHPHTDLEPDGAPVAVEAEQRQGQFYAYWLSLFSQLVPQAILDVANTMPVQTTLLSFMTGRRARQSKHDPTKKKKKNPKLELQNSEIVKDNPNAHTPKSPKSGGWFQLK